MYGETVEGIVREAQEATVEGAHAVTVMHCVQKHLMLLGVERHTAGAIASGNAKFDRRLIHIGEGQRKLDGVPVKLIVGRSENGDVTYGDFKVALDPELVVKWTVDEGEQVWAFDLETLDLLHVPTLDEVEKMSVACARLKDIEGGVI